MNMEELTIKLDGKEATVLLDALGKALGQPGLKMTINQDYVDACNRIIDKVNDAIEKETLIF